MPLGLDVPLMETERLRLRGHCPEDLADCARLWADPVVTRYIGGRGFTREEVWARILRYVGHWCWFGFGYWLVEEKVSHNFVGEVGFADYQRPIEPSINGIPELGWAVETSMSGQGYATESVQAAIGWLEVHRKFARTVCLVAPDNLPSIRVATKCGYRVQEITSYRGQPTALFTRQLGMSLGHNEPAQPGPKSLCRATAETALRKPRNG